jgi:hypothetical protein
VDQGNLSMEGVTVAASRGWMTPLRAALLMVGAVLGGVALSLVLGSSPAHAADGDGSGPDLAPLGSVTSVVTTTVSTIHQTVPAVQRSVSATAQPVVTPAVASVGTALTTIHQLVAPVVDTVLPLAQHIVAAPDWTRASSAPAHLIPGGPRGTVAGALPMAQNGAGSGSLPDPILTSSPGAPPAALGVLLTLSALVLLAARRRFDDDALPASPTFETDTSPA